MLVFFFSVVPDDELISIPFLLLRNEVATSSASRHLTDESEGARLVSEVSSLGSITLVIPRRRIPSADSRE